MNNICLSLSDDLQIKLAEKTPVIHIKEQVDLHWGDVVSIQGESGIGKTTLMSILAGLLRPCQGDIQYFSSNGDSLIDEAFNKSKQEQCIRQLSHFVFQDAHMIPPLTCLENMMLAAKISKNKHLDKLLYQEIQRKMEALNLDDRSASNVKMGWLRAFGRFFTGEHPEFSTQYYKANKYPHQLSGGERRRFAMLSATLGHNNILFADEPTTGLDDKSTESIIKLLSDWVRPLDGGNHQRVLVFISHHQESIDALNPTRRFTYSRELGLIEHEKEFNVSN